MGCGCGNSKRVSLPVWVEQAAMCRVCPESNGSLLRSPTRCGLSGLDLRDHVLRVSCPLGSVRPKGVVWWLGTEWIGVPYPVRLFVWWAGSRHYRPGSWRGCGCARLPKALYRLALRKIRRPYVERPNRQRPEPIAAT